MFERLIWLDDRMLLDDIMFRLELSKSHNWERGDDCFRFYKDRFLIEQYARFWSSNTDFEAQNILELGIWDGGSIAFWFEYFHPKKYVAIDLQERADSKYFQLYKASRGLETRVKTFWGTDQADSVALREIIKKEFTDHLDLVIDDASHMYEATKDSFETLFPFLRPGGLYIIEDWSWPYYIGNLGAAHPLATATEPTKLLIQLLGATGSSPQLVAQLTVFNGFVAIERGKLELSKLDFRIENHISRRSRLSRLQARINRRARPAVRCTRWVLSRLFRKFFTQRGPTRLHRSPK